MNNKRQIEEVRVHQNLKFAAFQSFRVFLTKFIFKFFLVQELSGMQMST